jgi:hypothetical protein
MELEKESNTGHGGARQGAGRPKGTGNKLTAKDLLDECTKVVGKPFATALMEGYRDSILNEDTKLRSTYEKIIIDKVATTMLDVEVEDNTDIVKNKLLAFEAALKSAASINNTEDKDNATD